MVSHKVFQKNWKVEFLIKQHVERINDENKQMIPSGTISNKLCIAALNESKIQFLPKGSNPNNNDCSKL